MTWNIHVGDAIEVMATMPDESVNCIVTSPPYWGLRNYGCAGQYGLERTPEEYVAQMVSVFREARRVLRADGTLWLNLGDSYAIRIAQGFDHVDGLKPKNLAGIPWRVAFALQADGWYLRQDIIWHKPNPMPESVRDRCTKSHEYMFLLTKSERYWYDAKAIAEPAIHSGRILDYTGEQKSNSCDPKFMATRPKNRLITVKETRNRRSVWTIATQPYAGAHFATFPPKLIEPCILAGCPVDGTVIDPFAGSGTTGVVAVMHDRNFIGIELNPAYVDLARQRIDAAAALPKQAELFEEKINDSKRHFQAFTRTPQK